MEIVTALLAACVIGYAVYSLAETLLLGHAAKSVVGLGQQAGAEAGAGDCAEVLESFPSVWEEGSARVRYHGELWRARLESPVATPPAAGSRVRILRVEGLTLIVAPEESPAD